MLCQDFRNGSLAEKKFFFTSITHLRIIIMQITHGQHLNWFAMSNNTR